MASQDQTGQQSTSSGIVRAFGRGYTIVKTTLLSTVGGSSTEPEVHECKLPGCNQPCFVENNGHVHDFCGRSHAQQYRSQEEAARKRLRLTSSRQYAVMGTPTDRSQYYGDVADIHLPLGQSSGGMPTYAIVTSTCTFSNGRGSSQGYAHHSGPTSEWNVTNNYGKLESNVIRFYNRDEPYYEFTNFYPAPIVLDDKEWPTTEHYFQAQKFIGTPFAEKIRGFNRPRQAFDYSRSPTVSHWRRTDWERVKINVMHKALLAKFTRHGYLRQKLIGTGDMYLIEHSPYDNFWGNGGNDRGQNHLGLLLMEVRSELLKGMGSADVAKATVHHEPARERVGDPRPLSGNSNPASSPCKIEKESENCQRPADPLLVQELSGSQAHTDGEDTAPNLIDFTDNELVSYGASDKAEKSVVDELMIAKDLSMTLKAPLLSTSTTADASEATTTEENESAPLETAAIPAAGTGTEPVVKSTNEPSVEETVNSSVEITTGTVTPTNVVEESTTDSAKHITEEPPTELAASTGTRNITENPVSVKDQPVAVGSTGQSPAALQTGGGGFPEVPTAAGGLPPDAGVANDLSIADEDEAMDTQLQAEPRIEGSSHSVPQPAVNSEENGMDTSPSGPLPAEEEEHMDDSPT